MTTETTEKRRYVRLPMNDDMMIRYGHRGRSFFGSCKELSPAGAFVSTKTPAPFGSEVNLKFTLPGHESPLVVKGKVVRVHRDTRNRSTSAAPGMNIKFTKMTSQTEQELKSYLVPRMRQMVIRQLAERRRTPKVSS